MCWLLLITLSCLLPAQPLSAAFLQECEGVIINKIPNPNPECSQFVYCNGDNSYYCNGDCTEPAECNATAANAGAASTAETATEAQTTLATDTTEASSDASGSGSDSDSSSSSQSTQPVDSTSQSSTDSTSTTPTTTAATTVESSSSSGSSSTVAGTSSQESGGSGSSLHMQCRKLGRLEERLYPYPANHNYFYQCIAGYLLLQQCPSHFHFQPELGQCMADKFYRW